GVYTSVVNIDGVNLTPTFINDSRITVNIPAQSAGVHKIKLVKRDMISRPLAVAVVQPVNIISAIKDGSVTITGTGFGTKPGSSFTDLGVFIKHDSNTYKPYISSWSSTKIVVSGSDAHEGDLLTVKALYGQDQEPIRSH
ncbi:MAG TPA: IPT/TIG domain-containing protein, partial [Candidatus Methanoperedens sp.]